MMFSLKEDRESDRQEARELLRNQPQSKIKLPNEYGSEGKIAWQSATDATAGIGFGSVWQVIINYTYSWKWLDGYWDSDSRSYKLLFFAFDEADAKDRIECWKDEFKHAKSYDSFSCTEPKKVADSKADGEKILEQMKEEAKNSGWSFREDNDHILCLPTKKMYDGMKKSLDWATAVLKKMKDQDQAQLKAKWLESPEGKRWKELFDKEQRIIAKEQAARETRERNEEAREMHSQEVANCLHKRSELHPEYNIGAVPVIVRGGRKFQGTGFVIAIENVVGTYSYYAQDVESCIAKLWLPTEPANKFASANLKFCKLDTSVSPEECKRAFESYCQHKVQDTVAWCRKKDPNKSDLELRRWASNILKKYNPDTDFSKWLGDLGDVETEKVKSTVEWAIRLGYPLRKTQTIITRALAKKGITDLARHRGVIELLLTTRFGKQTLFT